MIPQHLSLSNEHFTPLNIVKKVKDVFGGQIDTDPATCEKINLLRINAKTIYTKETDGLKVGNKWNGNVFLNPPGGKTKNNSNQQAWFITARWKYHRKEIESLIFIGFNIEILRLAGDLLNYTTVCVPNNRIAYDKYDDVNKEFVCTTSPPHATAIIYLGNKERTFEKHFREIGAVWRFDPV